MQHRFFIIDDDPAVRRMLQDIVRESALGVVTGVAASGGEAYQMLAQQGADVVLVDLLLPDMDGIELVRLLSGLDISVFVMISQVQTKSMVEAAYDAGVAFFVHKPINNREVKAVLARVCETLQLKQAVKSIYRSVADLEPRPQSSPSSRDQARSRIKSLLRELGIGGEAGAREIEEAALYISQGGVRDNVAVKDLLAYLAGDNATAQKATEQRMRRAVQAALRHLVSLGLEDYTHPRFESFAPVYFDFSEVRQEMRFVEGHAPHGGKISLKRFLIALAHEAELR